MRRPGNVWAIEGRSLAGVAAKMREVPHIMGEGVPGPQAAATARTIGRAAAGVRVLPIVGTITARGYWGLPGVSDYSAAFASAVGDPSVGAIVLEIDSPGGEVYGVEELAQQIRAATSVKPVLAVANAMAASAAYWLAAQASELWVTPSGEVGSVGVYAMHEDWSRALDSMGVTVTLVSAGEGKTAGNPAQPLSDSALADLQSAVDRFYGMFSASVAKGRGVPASKVRDTWQAKMYGAEDAVRLGLADKVGTLEETIQRAGKAAIGRARLAAEVDLEVEARVRQRRH